MFLKTPILVISTGLTIFIGTAGLPHVLMRFFTVPNAQAARTSVVWTIGLIAFFTAIVTLIGFGARAMLGQGAREGGRRGRQPRGAAAGAVARRRRGDDRRRHRARAVLRRGVRDDPRGRRGARAGLGERDHPRPVGERAQARQRGVRARRRRAIAALGVGVAAIVATLPIGSGFNVTVLVSMAFVFAASANFPPLLLALTWRRFNTAGALTGIVVGIIASVVMIVLSPPVWPGPDSQGSPSPLTFPGIVTIPIGFLGCFVGTWLGSPDEGRAHVTTSCSCAPRPASAPRAARRCGRGAAASRARRSRRAQART